MSFRLLRSVDRSFLYGWFVLICLKFRMGLRDAELHPFKSDRVAV